MARGINSADRAELAGMSWSFTRLLLGGNASTINARVAPHSLTSCPGSATLRMMEWMISLVVAVTLLAFPPTRWLAKTVFITVPLALLGLLLWSEPDLSD